MKQSPISWLKSLRESRGLASGLLDGAGMYLHPSGLIIPYHDITGSKIYKTGRVLYQNPLSNKDTYAWIAPKKSPACYWSKSAIVNHAVSLADIATPIYLVTDELDAIALQARLTAQGMAGSVLAIIELSDLDTLKNALKTIEIVGRTVYINYPNAPIYCYPESLIFGFLGVLGAIPKILKYGEGEGDIAEAIYKSAGLKPIDMQSTHTAQYMRYLASTTKGASKDYIELIDDNPELQQFLTDLVNIRLPIITSAYEITQIYKKVTGADYTGNTIVLFKSIHKILHLTNRVVSLNRKSTVLYCTDNHDYWEHKTSAQWCKKYMGQKIYGQD